MKELTNVGEEIEKAIKKSGNLRQGIIFGEWKEIVGKLSEKSSPLWVKDRVLLVGVEDSTYLHHMTLNRKKYIEKIREILKDDYIDDIRFKISKVRKFEYQAVIPKKVRQKKSKSSFREDMTLDEKIEVLKNKSKERENSLEELGYKKCIKCGNMFLDERELCKICSQESNGGKIDDN